MLESLPEMGSTGEAILFVVTAVIMVACALGVLFAKKAAYAAVNMVGVMLGIAVLYFANNAPFLGVAHVVVYTGAIMMLFLFVLMMIGVGASDEYQRQSRARIAASVALGIGLALIFGAIVAHTTLTSTPTSVDPYSNQPITDLAYDLLYYHWFSVILSGALLVTAAIGAMLLTHSDQLSVKFTQAVAARAKMRAWKETGRPLSPLPSPGVYAASNAADVPAISGETLEPVETSVPRVLRVRGLDRTIGQVEPEVAQSLMLARRDSSASPFGAAASAVRRSGAWGMPGPTAPTGMNQPLAPETDASDSDITTADDQPQEEQK